MKRLNIGVFPHKSDLSAAGDRRRLISWANSRGHRVFVNRTSKIDLAYISVASNFLHLSKELRVPRIFDLIDPYLIGDTYLKDRIRGSVKQFMWGNPHKFTKFSSIVAEAVSNVDVVVCSSPEQANLIRTFNPNVFDILDNHDEIPVSLSERSRLVEPTYSILWEGSPYTLDALIEVTNGIQLPGHIVINAVTDSHRFRALNRYFPQDVQKYCRRKFINAELNLVSWSPKSLVASAKKCNVSVIPVNTRSEFHSLKPENRIMIMFKLGIPVVASTTPSHLRVESRLGLEITASTPDDWTKRIAAYVSNPALIQEAIDAGRRYLDEYHNSEILFKKWDNVVASLT